MKTSNKLFVAAVALVLGSLATYDAALRAEYRTGHYKDALYNYDALAFRNFDKVAVPAAGAMNVKIVAGPFGVHVNKEVAEYVRVTQQCEQLTVALAYPKERKWLGRQNAVVISCPRLQALSTDGVYTVAGQPQVKKQVEYGNESHVLVKGFSQDSLTLTQDHASTVRFVGNTLGQLRATTGLSVGSGSKLLLDPTNRIQAATLAMEHQSQLELEVAIPQLRSRFSDSTTVVLKGAAAHSIGTK